MSVVKNVRRFTLALFAASTAIAGCTSDPMAPEPQPTPDLSLVGNVLGTTTTTVRKVLGLVRCLPLASASGARSIGPSGGTLQVGEYSLTIPAGALDRTVRITMQQVRDTVNSVRFGPEGLRFSRPAKLTMSYDNCSGLPVGRDHRIAYVDESLRILEAPTSRDDRRNDEVSADIDHFSRYAVAW